MGEALRLSKEEARVYAMRSAKQSPRMEHRYLIEGEHVTLKQIAARFGRSDSWAAKRMKDLRSKPGKVTWDDLK